MDGNRHNHDQGNLAALCLECHNLTQLVGGFDRKLDTDQVLLYRDDWQVRVSRVRDGGGGSPLGAGLALSSPPMDLDGGLDIELATTLAELYREREEWWSLALLYNRIGNHELRDKYLDLAMDGDPTDELLVRARRLQGRLGEIPEVLDRYLEELMSQPSRDWTYVHHLLLEAGRTMDALRVFAEGLDECLDQDNPFTAAYYMARDIELITGLFVEALRRAAAEDDLWWQVRSLQELEWSAPLAAFLEEKADQIRASDDLMLRRLLAEHEGDTEQVRALAIAIAEDPMSGFGVADLAEDEAHEDEIGEAPAPPAA